MPEAERITDPDLSGMPVLKNTEAGLSLVGKGMTLTADFTSMLPRLKQSNLEHEMLVKAARIKGRSGLKLLDATAGFGEDSLILAAAGFKCRLYEYDHVIASLLRDALFRAQNIPDLSGITANMELFEENSIAAMKVIAGHSAVGDEYIPDVILLDPMFPARQKSASVKKKFQLLQCLEHPCSDESELLEAALSVRPHKIVIKRPLKGPYLAGVKPSYSLSGKAIRYDCIVMA